MFVVVMWPDNYCDDSYAGIAGPFETEEQAQAYINPRRIIGRLPRPQRYWDIEELIEPFSKGKPSPF